MTILKLHPVWLYLFLWGIPSPLFSQFKTAPAIISGYSMTDSAKADTILLHILHEFGSGATFQPKITYKTVAKNGYFKFVLPVSSKPFYISSWNLKNYAPFAYEKHALQHNMVESGDSIFIKFDDKTKQTTFSGRGAEKFSWRNNVVQFQSQFLYTNSSPEKMRKNLWISTQRKLEHNLRTLDSIKHKLSKSTYFVLRNDAMDPYFVIYSLFAGDQFGQISRDTAMINFERRLYEEKLINYVPDTSNSLLTSYSLKSGVALMNVARSKYIYNSLKHTPNSKDQYNFLKDYYPKGILRDKVITSYITMQISSGGLNDRLLSDAISEVKHQPYKSLLLKMKNSYGTGQPVRDFSFNDAKGNLVTLANLKGKAILIDLWFTGCTGCIAVAKNLPVIEQAFEGNSNIAFVSLCTDAKSTTWLKSIDPALTREHGGTKYTHYTTPSTVYLHTGNRNGDIHPFLKRYNPGGSYPQLILIDKKGNILSVDVPKPMDKAGTVELIAYLKKTLKRLEK